MIADSLATYTPGVSERRGGTTRCTHSGLKNTGAQSTNAIVATRVYDAYGMVRSTTGTWSGPFGYRSEAEIPPNPEDRGEGNEARLVGRNRDAGGYGYQEDETGLRLLGHRYYDASTGRFLTRDPIKDGRNWYSYCDGDPINGVDPTGLYRLILGKHPVNGAPNLFHWFIIIEEDNGDYWIYEGGRDGFPPKVKAGGPTTSGTPHGKGGYKKRRTGETLTELFRKKGSGQHARKLADQFAVEYSALKVNYGAYQNSNSFAFLLLWLLTGRMWTITPVSDLLRSPGWMGGEVTLGPMPIGGPKRTPVYYPPTKF